MENDPSKYDYASSGINEGLKNIDTDKHDMHEQEKTRFEQDTDFRRYLAIWVMIIVPVWLVIVYAVLILNGTGCIRVDPKVMVSLLVTTTANVLGLAYIVLKGIFSIKK